MDQAVWANTKKLNELVPNNENLTQEWSLSGASKSALRTGFKMGPFYLDAGHSVFSSWNVLLISHGHADHIFSLPSLSKKFLTFPYFPGELDIFYFISKQMS